MADGQERKVKGVWEGEGSVMSGRQLGDFYCRTYCYYYIGRVTFFALKMHFCNIRDILFLIAFLLTTLYSRKTL